MTAPQRSKHARQSSGHAGKRPGTSSNPAVCCSFTRLADPKSLRPNPQNPNRHPVEQLELLARIISYQGWRRAPVVSKQSGLLVTGHGAVQAALRRGWTKIPVDEQSFKSPEEENAHMLADNKLAELSELDDEQVSAVLSELAAAQFSIDLTGFDVSALSSGDGPAEPTDHSGEIQPKFEVVVECRDEDEQQAVFEQLTQDGRSCRLLTL